MLLLYLLYRGQEKGVLILRIKDLCPAVNFSNQPVLISKILYRFGLVKLGKNGLNICWSLIYHSRPAGVGQQRLHLLFLLSHIVVFHYYLVCVQLLYSMCAELEGETLKILNSVILWGLHEGKCLSFLISFHLTHCFYNK